MNCKIATSLHVLVVDNSADYLDAVSRLLATYGCIESTRQALSGQEAIERLGSLHPDLVLMDIAMPGINGLEVTRIIKSLPDAPKVIIVTLYDTPAYRKAARAVGADAFLGKSDLGAQLQTTIKELFPDACTGLETG